MSVFRVNMSNKNCQEEETKILPEAEGPVACTVEGVEPRSCQLAKFVDDSEGYQINSI